MEDGGKYPIWDCAVNGFWKENNNTAGETASLVRMSGFWYRKMKRTWSGLSSQVKSRPGGSLGARLWALEACCKNCRSSYFWREDWVGSQSRTCIACACACAWLDLKETVSLVSPVSGVPGLAGCVQKGQGCIPFSFESHGRGHGSCSICLLR